MPNLRQLLADHANVLVLDAASARVQVGWLTAGGPWQWYAAVEEAGTGVFRGVEVLGKPVSAADAFVFCEGPGSILGIRTAAMAIRSWRVLHARPVYRYCSLALVAGVLGRPDVAVIADARRDTWHVYRHGGPLRRVATADLAGPHAMPEHFRNWSAVPAGTEIVPYSLDDLLSRAGDADLFQPTDAPDAFLHEEPSYVTWTPQIHRAPAAP